MLFEQCVNILKKFNDFPYDDLIMARVLNLVGLSGSKEYSMKRDSSFEKDTELCYRSEAALQTAFLIRYKRLGPQHVDTIDTLNILAGLHMKMKYFRKAKQSYFEVFTVRKILFGNFHPSVAIAERSLASVCYKLKEMKHARNHYSSALNIFLFNGLLSHPFVEEVKDRLREIGGIDHSQHA